MAEKTDKIVSIATTSLALATDALNLYLRLQAQGGREPTPEEMAGLKERRDAAESDWTALLPES